MDLELDSALIDSLLAGNGWGNLLSFILVLFLTFTASRVAQLLFQGRFRTWAEATDNDLDDAILDATERPVGLIILAVGFRIAAHALVIPEKLAVMIDHVITVVITLFVAWMATRLADAVRLVFIDPWVAETETKLDDQIVPILDKTIKAAIWSIAVLICFSNLGYDILSLITGLGIGGLAVAMAAQDTLSNVFGSVTIFADHPFQVGDLVTVGNHKGVVTEVGLRSTRLQTLTGDVVNVPNRQMVADATVNHSPAEAWRYAATVGLVYDTTHEQLQAALAGLKEILSSHPRVRDDFAARFTNFGDSALELTFAFWVEDPSIGVYLDTISEVNLAIKARFDAEGWNMAFPTITLHLDSVPTALAARSRVGAA